MCPVAKNQNIKQKQYCNKVKTSQNSLHQKKKKKNSLKKEMLLLLLLLSGFSRV